jgi:hypothetical protein
MTFFFQKKEAKSVFLLHTGLMRRITPVKFFFFQKKKQKALVLHRRRLWATHNRAKRAQGGLGGFAPQETNSLAEFFFFQKKQQKALVLLRSSWFLPITSSKPTQGVWGGVAPKKAARRWSIGLIVNWIVY